MAYADSIRTTDYTREELATLIDDNNTQGITNKQLSNAVTTAGTRPNFTATLTPAPTAYTDGMSFAIKMHESLITNAGATLNVNGLGAKDLKICTVGASVRDPFYAELSTYNTYIVTFSSDLDAFQIANPTFSGGSVSFTTTIGSQAGTASITSQTCGYTYINANTVFINYNVNFGLASATADYITFTLPVNARSESIARPLGSGYVAGISGYADYGVLCYCDNATRFAIYRHDQIDIPIDPSMVFRFTGIYIAA